MVPADGLKRDLRVWLNNAKYFMAEVDNNTLGTFGYKDLAKALDMGKNIIYRYMTGSKVPSDIFLSKFSYFLFETLDLDLAVFKNGQALLDTDFSTLHPAMQSDKRTKSVAPKTDGEPPPFSQDEMNLLMTLRKWATGSEYQVMTFERCRRAINLFDTMSEFVEALNKKERHSGL